MPLRSLRPCKQTGCTQLTRDVKGYCPDHIHLAQDQVRGAHSEYSRNRTDAKEQSFYHSPPWIKVRGMAWHRDHGLCQHCLRDGRVTFADVVHHLVPIKVNWLLRLVLGNLVSLCDGCHAKEHRKG